MTSSTHPFLILPAGRVKWKFGWNTQSTGAKQKMSIWNPIAPPGYAPLGSFYKRDPSSGDLSRSVPTDADGSVLFIKKAYAKPTIRLSRVIWNSGGAGAKYKTRVYRPENPSGYTAIGDYCHPSYSTPTKQELESVWCVRNDLILNRGDAWKDRNVWKDHGTGANQDATLYRAALGTFRAAQSHSRHPDVPLFIVPDSWRDCCMGIGEGCDKQKLAGVCDRFMQSDYCKANPDDPACACINRPVSKKTGKQLHPILSPVCTTDAYLTQSIQTALKGSLNYQECTVASDIIQEGGSVDIGKFKAQNMCQQIVGGSQPMPTAGSGSGPEASLGTAQDMTWLYAAIGGGVFLILLVLVLIVAL